MLPPSSACEPGASRIQYKLPRLHQLKGEGALSMLLVVKVLLRNVCIQLVLRVGMKHFGVAGLKLYPPGSASRFPAKSPTQKGGGASM